MPLISAIRCDVCDLSLPASMGGYMYVLDAAGNRVTCPHPLEFSTVERVTGLDWQAAKDKGLVGFVTDCLCFSCTSQVAVDVDRDAKRCPKCDSSDLRPLQAAVGATCPRCNRGELKAHAIGVA